ncbi:MAG: bifunctional nuclease family protein [Tannerellaceae bacterium]|nr:bifunctional nuclease family protein [Tannerellaceae bacterium]
MDSRIKLTVQGLTNSQIQSGAYALILAEELGPRRIPVVIGIAEAQSIAIALEHITPPRPLTHDLFLIVLESLNVRLREVCIYKFENDIFYSKLFFEKDGQPITIDSRTSDAIAIALRAECDIYTTEKVVDDCGIVLDDLDFYDDEDEDEDDDDDVENDLYELDPDDIEDEVELMKWLSLLDNDELFFRLDEAVLDEHYEHAKMYQDELSRRKKDNRNA